METHLTDVGSEFPVMERDSSKKRVSPISFLCVVYLCAWCILPQLQEAWLYRILACGCAVLWLLSSMSFNAFSRRMLGDSTFKLGIVFLILVVVVSVIEEFRF